MQAARERAANSLVRTSSNSRLTIRVNASQRPLALSLTLSGSAQCILRADRRDKRPRRFERIQPATIVIGREIPDVLRTRVKDSDKERKLENVRKLRHGEKHNLPLFVDSFRRDARRFWSFFPANFSNARLNHCDALTTTKNRRGGDILNL